MRHALVVVLALLVLSGCGGGSTPPPPPAECGAATCAGCCSSSGVCVAGTIRAACGGGGQACAACADALLCRDNACAPEAEPDAGQRADAGPPATDAGSLIPVTLRWRYASRGTCTASAATDDAYVECAATHSVAEGRVQGLWFDNYFGCGLKRDGGSASIDCSQNCQDSMGYCAGPDGGIGRQRLVLSCSEVRGVAQLNVCDWQPPTQ